MRYNNNMKILLLPTTLTSSFIWSLILSILQQQTDMVEIQTHQTYHLELYVVLDNALYKSFDSDSDALITRTQHIVNQVDTIFRHHNVRVHLAGIEIWSQADRIQVNSDYGTVLAHFNTYAMRETKFDGADHVHLITGFNSFDENVVGLAYVNTMCSLRHATGFTTDSKHTSTHRTAAILAHELGHGLSIGHDLDSCSCPGGTNRCIMSAYVVYPTAQHLSSCSLQSLQTYLDSYKSACMLNKPNMTTLSSNINNNKCGNNIVDDGEDCDCGDPYFCNNPCCDAHTCRYTQYDAQCFEGACCTKDCKLIPAGMLCRNIKEDDRFDGHSTSSCDLPDYCDGQNPVCVDSYKEDLTSCDDSQGLCRNGECISHRLQCKAIWRGETTTVANPQCFELLNKRGDSSGHCGRTNGHYEPCPTKDTSCGKLYCTGMPNFYDMKVGWSRWYKSITLRVDSVVHRCVMADFVSGRSQPDQGKSMFVHLDVK